VAKFVHHLQIYSRDLGLLYSRENLIGFNMFQFWDHLYLAEYPNDTRLHVIWFPVSGILETGTGYWKPNRVQYVSSLGPFVSRGISSIWDVVDVTSLLICAQSSKTLPTFGLNTRSIFSSEGETPMGCIGDRRRQAICPSHPIHLFGRILFRYSDTVRPQYEEAPSCWSVYMEECHLRATLETFTDYLIYVSVSQMSVCALLTQDTASACLLKLF
jgi:hypothetical protein